jgi:hypothetical protein
MTIVPGVKINAAVSATGSATRSTVGVTSTVIYTAPANGYAIIEVVASLTGTAGVAASAYVIVGANYILENNTVTSGTNTKDVNKLGVYVGPGQSLTAVAEISGGGSATSGVSIAGVEFVNS